MLISLSVASASFSDFWPTSLNAMPYAGQYGGNGLFLSVLVFI